MGIIIIIIIGPKSRTERPRKTKIGTEVVHLTRDFNDLDTTFKVKRSKVKVMCEAGAYCSVLLRRSSRVEFSSSTRPRRDKLSSF